MKSLKKAILGLCALSICLFGFGCSLRNFSSSSEEGNVSSSESVASEDKGNSEENTPGNSGEEGGETPSEAASVKIQDLNKRLLTVGSAVSIYKDQFVFAGGAAWENTTFAVTYNGEMVTVTDDADEECFTFTAAQAGTYVISVATSENADSTQEYILRAVTMDEVMNFEEGEVDSTYVRYSGMEDCGKAITYSINTDVEKVSNGTSSLKAEIPAEVPAGNWPTMTFTNLPRANMEDYTYLAIDIYPEADGVETITLTFKLFVNGDTQCGDYGKELKVGEWNSVKIPLAFFEQNGVDFSKDKLEKLDVYFNTGDTPANGATLYVDNFGFIAEQAENGLNLVEDFERVGTQNNFSMPAIEGIKMATVDAPAEFTNASGKVLELDYTAATTTANGGCLMFSPYTEGGIYAFNNTGLNNTVQFDLYNPNGVRVQATIMIYKKEGDRINVASDRTTIVEAGEQSTITLNLRAGEFDKAIYDVRIEFWLHQDPVDYSNFKLYVDNICYGVDETVFAPNMEQPSTLQKVVGQTYTVVVPMATDYYGNAITTNVVSVSDPNGNTVEMTDGTVTFTTAGNYVVTFEANAHGKTITKQQTIMVEAARVDFETVGDLQKMIGDTYSIVKPNATTNVDGSTVAVSVKSVTDPSGGTVTVTDDIITFDLIGEYSIVFSAEIGGVEFTVTQSVLVGGDPYVTYHPESIYYMQIGDTFTVKASELDAGVVNYQYTVKSPSGETVAVTGTKNGFAFTVTESGVYTLKFTVGAEELDEYALNIIATAFLLNFEGDALDSRMKKGDSNSREVELSTDMAATGKQSAKVTLPANSVWSGFRVSMNGAKANDYAYIVADVYVQTTWTKAINTHARLITYNGDDLRMNQSVNYDLPVNTWTTVRVPLAYFATESGRTSFDVNEVIESFTLMVRNEEVPTVDMVWYVDNVALVADGMEENFDGIGATQTLRLAKRNSAGHGTMTTVVAPEEFTLAKGRALKLVYGTENGEGIELNPYKVGDFQSGDVNGLAFRSRSYATTTIGNAKTLSIDVYNPTDVTIQIIFNIYFTEGGNKEYAAINVEPGRVETVMVDLTEISNKGIYFVRVGTWVCNEVVEGRTLYLDNLRYGY